MGLERLKLQERIMIFSPYNVGKSEEQFPKDTVGQQLANCWPSVGQLLANHWPTDGQQLADRWPTVGRQFLIHISQRTDDMKCLSYVQNPLTQRVSSI